jgi:hypothetical protein
MQGIAQPTKVSEAIPVVENAGRAMSSGTPSLWMRGD